MSQNTIYTVYLIKADGENISRTKPITKEQSRELLIFSRIQKRKLNISEKYSKHKINRTAVNKKTVVKSKTMKRRQLATVVVTKKRAKQNRDNNNNKGDAESGHNMPPPLRPLFMI